ncbi:MAG TPA: hypothetical protein G4N98_01630 [Thermoflexia bacterium]|nr:hypothetical protein [Thermoflexia bacterium]
MNDINTYRRQPRLLLADMREYSTLAGTGEIARRYLAMNAFDGVLTIIGVLMGNYVGGVQDPRVVINIGLSTSLAMGISGLWGAYLTESAERERELAELEQATLSSLRQTKISRASHLAVITVSLVDGFAPFAAAMIVLLPLFFAAVIGNVMITYLLSLMTALLTLFGLGIFLGKISGRSLIGYGLRTLMAGFVSITLSYLLGGGHGG